MEERDLVNFVNWLIENQEEVKESSFDEAVLWINELSTSNEGRDKLNQLLDIYKKSNMNNLFKDGGKLKYLRCLKSGGKSPDCGCKKAQDGAVLSTIIGLGDRVSLDSFANTKKKILEKLFKRLKK